MFSTCSQLTLRAYNPVIVGYNDLCSPAVVYVELQDQWNGPYFFFLKSIAQPPVNETAPIFFSRGVFPSYYHVISDFCHIWGPFMAKIEKKSVKKCLFGCPKPKSLKMTNLCHNCSGTLEQKIILFGFFQHKKYTKKCWKNPKSMIFC